MGPRIASMRHLDVDMAPALTKSSQAHDFGLPVKHKPLLTLHFSPSALTKPMDDFRSCKDVFKNTLNGVTLSPFSLSENNPDIVVENEQTFTVNHMEQEILDTSCPTTEEGQGIDQLNLENISLNVIANNSQNMEKSVDPTLDLFKDYNDSCGLILSKDGQNKNIIINTEICNVEDKKLRIENRLQCLLKRTAEINVRLLGTHTSSEINCVLNCISESYLDGTGDCSVSTLMQQIEGNILRQQHIPVSENSYFGSSKMKHASSKKEITSLVKLNPEYQQNLEEIAGPLQTQLKSVQDMFDSDATASSSDAESCDEMQNFNNSHQMELLIQRRAAWRWNKDKSKIGGKWTWLVTQLGELDHQLNDHLQHQKKLLANKSHVTFEDQSQSFSGSINGYHGLDFPSNSSTESDKCLSCARTRSFDHIMFKKRKLFWVKDFRNHSKINVPVPFRCGCTPSYAPCVLCLGNSDPTKPREQLKSFNIDQNISLVDPSYYPTSSFTTDISKRVHLEAVMCCSWWQQKSHSMAAQKHKKSAASQLNSSVPFGSEKQPTLKKHTNSFPVPFGPKRKYTKRKKSTQPNLNAVKIDPGVSDRELRPSRPKRSSTTHSWNHLLQDEIEEEEPAEESEEEFDGYQVSPVPSPSNTAKDIRARRRESSYDIDNIVIPYSMAATTRPEVLHYKEIPTPKWRFIDKPKMRNGDITTPPNNNNNKLTSSSHLHDLSVSLTSPSLMESEDEADLEEEDISDEAFRIRHEKYELEERKKFRTYLHPFHANAARSRAQKRADSKAESSGYNTPDAQSPKHLPDVEGTSPLTSPPIPSLAENSSELNPRTKRRLTNRTLTVSESSSREEQACVSPVSMDEISPYSPLQFPLTDEQYANLLKEMPPDYPTMEDRNFSYEDCNNVQSTAERPDSPRDLSLSSEASEDPNDPEWTFETSKAAANLFQSQPKKFFEY